MAKANEIEEEPFILQQNECNAKNVDTREERNRGGGTSIWWYLNLQKKEYLNESFEIQKRIAVTS